MFIENVCVHEKEPVYRAVVLDNGPDALRLFKRMFHHDLRRHRASDEQTKISLQSQFDSILEAAIKHGNHGIVRVFLGEDRDFNHVANKDLANKDKFRAGSLLNKAFLLAGNISFLHDTIERSRKTPEGLDREMLTARFAGQYGRFDIFGLVLDRLNSLRVTTTPFRARALKQAAANGHINTVKSLIEESTPTGMIQGALLAAAESNQTDVATFLAGKVSIPQCWSAIYAAVERRHFNLARAISPDKSYVYTRELEVACERGDVAAVTDLLKLGANASGAYFQSIKAAADQGHNEVVALMLDAGANPYFLAHGDYILTLEAQQQFRIVDRIATKILPTSDAEWLLGKVYSDGHGGIITRCLENGFDVKNHGTHLLGAAVLQERWDLVALIERRGLTIKEYLPRLAQGEALDPRGQVAQLIYHAYKVSEKPESYSHLIRNLPIEALLVDLAHLYENDPEARRLMPDIFSFLSRAHLRGAISRVHPTITEDAREDLVMDHLARLRLATPNRKQLCHRIKDLNASLRGIERMVSEIADTLVLGRQQVLAKDPSSWSAEEVSKRRSEARETVSRHLITEFDLPLISRFLSLWGLPTHTLPQRARPLLAVKPAWVSMIDAPFTTSNGYTVRCLEDESQLLQASQCLNNCLHGDGYTSASVQGTTRVFTLTNQKGRVVSALDLIRDEEGDISIANGSTWRERQFLGRDNRYPSIEENQAIRQFLQALRDGQIKTNIIPQTSSTTPLTESRPIQFITGIPLGGSDKMIRDHFLNFRIPGRFGKPEYRLIPPQTELYMLSQ